MIVLSLLRQGLGAQLAAQPGLVGLSLFMTFLVMAPTSNRVNNEALQPYLNKQIDQKTRWRRASPDPAVHGDAIERSGNDADVVHRRCSSAAGEELG
jgi:type III secretory pathway component EscR